jgi:gluconolactonase
MGSPYSQDVAPVAVLLRVEEVLMTIEMLTCGYGLIEGPRAAPDGSLYFSDVHNGGVRRLSPTGETEVVVPKRRGVGGIALHADGGIVVSGKNISHVRDGETRVLYERADVGGFNDLFTDDRGRIYVGSLRDDPFRVGGDERKTGDAYRIDAPGAAVVLYTAVALSNGIGFSPDRRRMYHSDSGISGVIAHDLDDDGELVGDSRAVFATLGRGFPDGLAVDTAGGVWVAAYGAGCVVRFTPDGVEDRRIAVPANDVTSLCFAGASLDELVVVTADNTDDASRAGSIFRISADEVGATGLPAPLARV